MKNKCNTCDQNIEDNLSSKREHLGDYEKISMYINGTTLHYIQEVKDAIERHGITSNFIAEELTPLYDSIHPLILMWIYNGLREWCDADTNERTKIYSEYISLN